MVKIKYVIMVSSSKFTCHNCGMTYTRKNYLKKHIIEKKCSSASNGVLIHQFENNAEFLLWKDSKEQRTMSKYTQDRGVWKTKFGKRIKYTCRRAGYVRLKDEETRKRALKRKGSCKINNHCTAYILYTEFKNGKIEAQYYPSHVNHHIEMKHLSISTTEKDKIADRLKVGVPMDRILDDVRENMFESPNLTRTHLITKYDLHNINAEYGISFKERLSDIDGISVDMLIDQYKDKFGKDTPFRFYKKQNEKDPSSTFEDADIMIVIMDQIQINTMKKFGNQKICIDSTHATNQYDFYLTTVMVVNDVDMGVPVAYAISNKENTTFMKTFFETIKEDCGVIVPNVFMSDDFPAYINAWKEIMGPPSNILLCTWHVDKNWRKNLTKVDKQFQKEVYKLIRTLLEELDENCFPEIINKAVEKLKPTPETETFGKYFEREYSSRYKMWAFAFRKYIGLNTNMKLEALHREIKIVHFNGIKNRRLDSLIVTLLKMNLKKEQARIAHLVLDTDTHTLKKIRERHAAGKAIPKEDISIIDDENAIVRSQSGLQSYSITRVKLECLCRMQCSNCDMCVHLFQCSCADNTVSGNFCKHLHLFGIIKSENLVSCDINETDDVLDDMAIRDGKEIHTLLQHAQSQKELVREKEICTTMKSTAYRILRSLDNLNDAEFEGDEDGKKILNLMNQAAKLIDLKGKPKDIAQKDDENAENSLKRVAPNKKFEKQVRLFSTKKKRDGKNAIRKPTLHQRNELKSMLNDEEMIPVVISCFEDHAYRQDE